jgi:hypothetical protein
MHHKIRGRKVRRSQTNLDTGLDLAHTVCVQNIFLWDASVCSEKSWFFPREHQAAFRNFRSRIELFIDEVVPSRIDVNHFSRAKSFSEISIMMNISAKRSVWSRERNSELFEAACFLHLFRSHTDGIIVRIKTLHIGRAKAELGVLIRFLILRPLRAQRCGAWCSQGQETENNP